MIAGSLPGDPRSPPAKCPTIGGRASGGFLQYAQIINPRNSMSITNTKGLLNMPGQNNCFLNSAVQVLWHLDIFRRSFRELCGHACMEDSCIFCALKELFAQFQYSQESALPPDALRRALAETFCDQRRFQLGFMDDAAECFENILMRIHFHIANNESEDMCSALHCIPHQKFAMTLVEQTVCHACGATSEPLPFTQMVHYVPSSALCSQAKLMKEKSDQMPSFSELLKRAGGLGDLRDCPSSCGAAIQIRKTLMNRPEIVSIGLVWDSERPTIEHIMDVFKTIGMSLKLQDVFHSVVDSRWASSATHQLVGIVTYYGKHYSTFFFHTKLRVWIYFDDAAVREIGPKWEQVVEKCCRGHFQPLLLLYANPHGTPVNTSTAPRVITVVPGHKKNMNAKDSCSIVAQHDKNSRIFPYPSSNNQRRALTPNPEVSCDISANIQPRRAVTPSGELSWSDESTHESNRPVKDNPTAYIRNCNTYDSQSLQYKSRHSDHSSNICSDNSDQARQNRVSASLSVPTCSYFSDMHQQKVASKPVNVVLNRPASVEDILKSARKASISEAEKVFCQMEEGVDIIGPEELDSAYISRKAVENVMHLQKLQRQRSVTCKGGHVFVGQRNSSSSLESLDNVFILRDKGPNGYLGPKLEFADVMNIARRRDSGNWSGDRSSASSSSTTSLDNPYLCAIGKRLPNCSRTVGRPGDPLTFADPGYDSFSLSSSDSYPSAINCPSGKLGQIPEHVQTAFMPYDLSQLQYCLKDLKSNDHFPFGFKDDCDKLCAEADIFVAKSVERENVGDISMAALLSDTAAAKARSAMDVPYTSSQALAMAKMKHSMCLIRSSNLHKKIKEAEAALCRKPKETLESSRSQSSNSTVNSKSHLDNAYKNSKEEFENISHETSKDSQQNSSYTEQSSSDKNIEIYATLPKRSLKKKGTLSSFVESFTGEESSDEKSIKDKINKTNEESKSDNQKSNCDQEKCLKSSGNKKKAHSSKSLNKDSDLSDYSSEWEHTKKQSLYRTYSGPTNSKNELSDMNTSNNQTFNEHPTKKQHRIRRKLMGGFMRRKNRSLPDLREGQDSGSETARSFDDCFFTQTPVSCQKKQVIKNPVSTNNNHQDPKKCNKIPSKSPENVKQPKKVSRTHTPPPYKPPPPITHSNSSVSTSPKRVVQHPNQEPTKDFQSIHTNHVISMPHPQELLKPKIAHHPPLCRDIKNHRKISAQYVPLEHSASSTAWLKELQMKQEELNQKKKLQEERERWLSECNLGTNDKLVPLQNSDSIQNTSLKMPPKLLEEKDHHAGKSSQRMKQTSNSASSSDTDHLKSVRDIASKFEKITVTPSNDEHVQDQVELSVPLMMHSTTHLLSTSAPVDNKIYMLPPQKTSVPQMDHPRLHPSVGHRLLGQVLEKSPVKDSDSSKNIAKDRLNGVNGAKQVYSNQSTSGSVYSPHLTDAQLTNVLRIGTNRSSFRNSNGPSDVQEENFARLPYVLHEAKRPDKPPDYETAIQRLEFLRNDRILANYYVANNCMSFEAILEQAKKRRAPKKSVTFSDKVVLVACAGDEDNDFIPNPLLERVYKQHFMQSSQPDIAPISNKEMEQNLKLVKDSVSVENSLMPDAKHQIQDSPKSNNQSPCHLCHKKTVETPNLYCPDCAFYMSRFQQK